MSEKKPDWAVIEAEYRAGVKSLRQISQGQGVSHVAIANRAKKEDWPRDLKAQIAAKAEAKINKAALDSSLNAERRVVSEKAVVDANVDLRVEIQLGHRRGLGRIAKVRDKLLGELEAVTDNADAFEKLAEVMDESGTDANGKVVRDRINEAYRKVISMPERIESLKKLAEVDEKVRKGEREAFGITGEEKPSDALTDMIGRIQRGSAIPVRAEVVDDAE